MSESESRPTPTPILPWAGRMPGLVERDHLPPPPEGLIADLVRIVGTEGVSMLDADRAAASVDMWGKGFLWKRMGLIPRPPDAVVSPVDERQVQEVVRYAAKQALPLTPGGARSGVCGGAIPLSGGIVLDSRRLRQIRDIDPDTLTVRAEAGVLGTELEAALQRRGLTLGHFPSSIGCSSVGGWLAARSAGQSSSRYGKIEDMVLELGCVLGSGEIVRPRRPTAGVDWIELLLGSEGTLGFVTDARLRLWPAPLAQIPRAWRFPDLVSGLEAMRDCFRAGLRPSVMRLYDAFDTWVALSDFRRAKVPAATGRERAEEPPVLEDLIPTGRTSPWSRRLTSWVLGSPRWLNHLASLPPSHLLVLVHEGAPGEAEAEAREAEAICKRHGGESRGEEPARRWLRKRWAVSRNLPRIYDAGGWVDTCEVAIGWRSVARLYRAIRKAVGPHAFVMAHFSHAYPDGCSIYFTFVGAAAEVDEGLGSYDRAWAAALGAADREGATLTHHHGVGLLKAPWLGREVGEGGMDLLRKLKGACDPQGIFNPGKLGL